MKNRATCQQPDRDVPTMKCGHPLPCPWHTIIIDLNKDTIEAPAGTSRKTLKKISDIIGAIKEE